MDAFRSIDPLTIVMKNEPRVSTSIVGHIKKHSFDAKIRGLNKLFYSMVV